MGSTFSHMAANRFFRFFALQGPLGRTTPSKCTSVFAVKLQSNAVFRWLTEACFFVLARLGCFLSKLIFELHFLHFSVLLYVPRETHNFQNAVRHFFGSFCNYAFHCRRIAKNEALKLPIFTSRFRKDNFADLNCKKPTRR